MKKYYKNKVRKARYGMTPVSGRVNRLASKKSPSRTFATRDPLDVYEQQRKERVQALVKRGESVEDIATASGMTVTQLRKLLST